MKRSIISLFAAGMLAGVGTVPAATELFNLGFNAGDLAGISQLEDPVVPTSVALDTWAKSRGWSDKVDTVGDVGHLYMFKGRVRGLSIALSSGFTDGVEYTVSALAKQNSGGANMKLTLAVTQANAGTGDYLMDNFENTTLTYYQPVVVNSGDATVTNVMQETFPMSGSWTAISGTFVYDSSLGSNVIVQLQGYDTGAETGTIRVDDFILSGPSTTADLVLTPDDELAMTIDVSDAVITNDITASYEEGLSETNITITSISVVDQSHAGAFTNLTSLPVTTLTDPSSNAVLSIEFDNTVAGLTVGETATGIVEIVWNDLSLPSSVTSSLPVNARFLVVNADNTLALFEHTGANANPRLGGLVARVAGGHGDGSTTGLGSTDGTFGTLDGAARTDGGCYQASFVSPVISVGITNNTGYPATIDALHFDAAKNYGKAPSNVTVSITGDISSTNIAYSGLVQYNGAPGDFDDFDIILTGLDDPVLDHGEGALIEFTFSDGYVDNSNAVALLDNIVLIGSGSNGAGLAKVPGGDVNFGVTSSDTTLSALIEMFYTEGDAATNILFNSVSFTNESHAGAFGYSGLISGLSTPETTNEIVTVVFSNTVANLAAGEEASATMLLSWNEVGLAERVYELDVYAVRPADTPAGVVAIFHTAFHIPDGATDGVIGEMELGSGLDEDIGSDDGTFGTLASPAAPAEASAWAANLENPVVTLTVTNKSAGDLILSSLNFDIGRRWVFSPTNCTLSVSGDVTADPALLDIIGLPQQPGDLSDFEDYDVSLTNLADHTLSTGESVVFTFTFEQRADGTAVPTLLDNIALMTLGGYANWSSSQGLTAGVNDAPTANPDGDGSDNLMEYATGGDPLTADSPAELWATEEGSTNWLYHVYNQRQDDDSLSYNVGASSNLVWDTMHDHLVEEVGTSPDPGTFKSVTNRTVMDISSKFIGLEVEQN